MSNAYTKNRITPFKPLYGKVYKTSKPCEVGSRKTQYPSDYDEMVGFPHTGLKGD